MSKSSLLFKNVYRVSRGLCDLRWGLTFLAIACGCVQAQSHADPMAVAEARMADAVRMDGTPGGIVLNKTLTIVGHDFYRYFSKAWRTLANTDHYSLAIVERPSAMRGSEIWVEHRNKRVFHTYVSPRRSAVKRVSERAVGVIYNAVVESELQQVLYHDPDLAKEELQ